MLTILPRRLSDISKERIADDMICFRWGRGPRSLCLPPPVVQSPIEIGFSQWGHTGHWNLPYKPMFPLSEHEEADSKAHNPETSSTEYQ